MGTVGGFRMRLEWYRVAPRPAFVIPVARRRAKMCQVRIEALEFSVPVMDLISPSVQKT
jgi:hypothetical protein